MSAIEPLVTSGSRPTLVVDLDGTLTHTDTLVESSLKYLRRSPLNLLRLPWLLLRGRAAFKRAIAAEVRLDATRLPYNAELLAWLRSEKVAGRQVVLATAADASIASSVAGHLGCFDQVLGSDGRRNLRGADKLALIRETVGDDFVYAGDHRADLPIWRAARAAVLVDVSPRVVRALRGGPPIEREFSGLRAGLADWMRALRVHQWLKNLLLFVPLLTAFSFLDPARLSKAMLAFIAFSLAASATYLVNDCWDLESDRAHARKRLRAFASGRIPILRGMGVALVSLLTALLLATFVSRGFLLLLLLYLAMTSTYSWMLKGYVLIDVLTLSLLYTLRVLAGSVAIGVTTSSWLLAFSVFIFLSLALVKRCAELVSLGAAGVETTSGRDYRVTDLAVLWPLGVGAALSAVVVFGLFISADDTRARYASPELLWLVGVGLVYWLARLWIKTSRGEMHDDPLVYALRDYGSRVTIFAMMATMVAAHFLSLRSLA